MIYNLIFHIFACEHPMLWWHMERLPRYLPLFNGKRIITIAQHDAVVEKKLCDLLGNDADIHLVPNVDDREGTHFFETSAPLVATLDPDTFLFYGHSKGVSYGELSSAIMYWCEAMYVHLLDRVENVKTAFADPRIDAYGVLKCVGTPGCGGGGWERIQWHYPGTFWWVRNNAVFGDAWAEYPHHTNSVELWPAWRIADSARAADGCPLPDEFGGPSVANGLFDRENWERYFTTHGVPNWAQALYDVLHIVPPDHSNVPLGWPMF